MIVCHAPPILFIHNPKTGGTSIMDIMLSLLPNCEVNKFGEHGFHRHANLAQIVDAIGPDFHNYYSFSFVRNPWDRAMSLWLHWIQNDREQRARLAESGIHDMEAWLREDSAWLEVASQRSYVESGQAHVSFIGEFETFEQDARHVVENFAAWEVPIPHSNTSRHSHYSHYFTPGARKLVAELAEWEIEEFNYKYERT
jgi:hypothetical protein